MAGNSNSGRRRDAVSERYKRILEESGAYERYKMILIKTENEANFIKAFEMGEDRASGKPLQRNENTNVDDPDRPTTDALIQTIATLRTELDSLRKGAGVAEEQ